MGFDFTKQGNFNSRFPDDGLTCAVILKKKKQLAGQSAIQILISQTHVSRELLEHWLLWIKT